MNTQVLTLSAKQNPFAPIGNPGIGDVAVSIERFALEKKAEVLRASAAIENILTTEQMEEANPVLRHIKTCLQLAEASRKAIKQPITDIGKRIDQTAKEYTEELQEEEARIKQLVANFIAQQQARELQELRETGESSVSASGGEGISAVEAWEFKIEDEAKAYAASPHLFELVPKKSLILSEAKSGHVLPGIKTWKTTAVRVKA